MKRFMAVLLAAILVLGLVACGGGSASQATNQPASQAPAGGASTGGATAEPTGELIGSGAVKFDTGKEMEGKLSVWFYEDGKRFIEPLFTDYQQYRPNVDLEVTYIAWSDYWTKLPVSVGSGNGPDLYYFHNAYHTLMVEEGLQEPYPEELVSLLREDFDNIDQFEYDGNVYYVPTGNGHGMVYYNKTLWEEAGLTENDIPTTWEETHELAKLLTKKDGDQLVVSGFNLWPVGAFREDWVYLSGKFQYSEDGKQSLLNDPDVKETYEYFLNWILEDGITSPTFPEAQQSFQNGIAAMVWNHPYFAGVLNANAPDLDFGVFAMPKFEGKARNWHYNNPDVSMGINVKASDAGKALAEDMLYLFFADDKYLIDWCYEQALAPTKKTIQGNDHLNSNPIIQVQMADSENSVYVGGSVSGYSTIITNSLIEPIVMAGKTWDDVIDDTVAELDKTLQASNFVPVERKWNHADELS